MDPVNPYALVRTTPVEAGTTPLSSSPPLPGSAAGPRQPPATLWERFRVIVASIGAMIWLGFKFLAPLFKLLPFLKTSLTMLISVWAYALFWGWSFAAGFVVLLFVHECGHLFVARAMGLRVGSPVFIPFLGAFIALKEAPRNAWVEALIGIGGPLLGSVGALVSVLIGLQTDSGLFMALGYTGFLLNLFNLIPLSPLDGGRIVTAISPWLWVVGLLIAGGIVFVTGFNFVLIIILIASLGRLFQLFRRKSAVERRYFEVSGMQRLVISALYFGLAGGLAFGMHVVHPLIHKS